MQQAKIAEHKKSIWQRLGFGYKPMERIPNIEGYVPGYLSADIQIEFGFIDRIRLLLSGRIMVQQALKTDVAVSKTQAFVGVSILQPGSNFDGR